MANVMTKRGNLDNVVTYEHYCDTREDLNNIDPQYITLGSVAVVLMGAAGLEVYMATSGKEWILLSGVSSSSNNTDDKISDKADYGAADYMTLKE